MRLQAAPKNLVLFQFFIWSSATLWQRVGMLLQRYRAYHQWQNNLICTLFIILLSEFRKFLFGSDSCLFIFKVSRQSKCSWESSYGLCCEKDTKRYCNIKIQKYVHVYHRIRRCNIRLGCFLWRAWGIFNEKSVVFQSSQKLLISNFSCHTSSDHF